MTVEHEEELQGDRIANVDDSERRALRSRFHEDLAAGRIDLGPLPEPRPVTEDNRDLRDPQELGRSLGQVKNFYSTRKLSEVYDLEVEVLDRVPNYDPQPVNHAQAYLDELTARAADGDKFAIELLTTGERLDDGEPGSRLDRNGDDTGPDA